MSKVVLFSFSTHRRLGLGGINLFRFLHRAMAPYGRLHSPNYPEGEYCKAETSPCDTSFVPMQTEKESCPLRHADVPDRQKNSEILCHDTPTFRFGFKKTIFRTDRRNSASLKSPFARSRISESPIALRLNLDRSTPNRRSSSSAFMADGVSRRGITIRCMGSRSFMVSPCHTKMIIRCSIAHIPLSFSGPNQRSRFPQRHTLPG